MKATALALAATLAFTGCAYLQTASRQVYFAAQQQHHPRQHTYKHMLNRDTFFVFGPLLNTPPPTGREFVVIAVSDSPQKGEVVDASPPTREGQHYGLNLPAGTYRLLVACAGTGNGLITEKEVVGECSLTLDPEAVPGKVMDSLELDVAQLAPATPGVLRVTVTPRPKLADSAFFPKGTIRALSDPIFSPQMASLGLYEPAAFLEAAPTMFYALEEDLGYKVPVIFVHGIEGSPRDFAAMVQRLDRRRYRPWFFYYPSGTSLPQLGEMFYRIFLAGRTIPRPDTPMVIVAHSMGGLIVRDALNRGQGTAQSSAVHCLITLASPLGGHPAAKRAGHAPVVIPSWRDLDPDSAFIRELFRKPLPAALDYHLFYAFGDDRFLKLGEPGDGVVPLSSQLAPLAQKESMEHFGFKTTHTGILSDPDAVEHVMRAIQSVKSTFPADHLRELDKGGYQVELPRDFSPLEAYLVRYTGHYMDALAAGTIQPIHPMQQQFVDACRGKRKPDLPASKAWVKLNALYPDRGELR